MYLSLRRASCRWQCCARRPVTSNPECSRPKNNRHRPRHACVSARRDRRIPLRTNCYCTDLTASCDHIFTLSGIHPAYMDGTVQSRCLHRQAKRQATFRGGSAPGDLRKDQGGVDAREQCGSCRLACHCGRRHTWTVSRPHRNLQDRRAGSEHQLFISR